MHRDSHQWWQCLQYYLLMAQAPASFTKSFGSVTDLNDGHWDIKILKIWRSHSCSMGILRTILFIMFPADLTRLYKTDIAFQIRRIDHHGKGQQMSHAIDTLQLPVSFRLSKCPLQLQSAWACAGGCIPSDRTNTWNGTRYSLQPRSLIGLWEERHQTRGWILLVQTLLSDPNENFGNTIAFGTFGLAQELYISNCDR